MACPTASCIRSGSSGSRAAIGSNPPAGNRGDPRPGSRSPGLVGRHRGRPLFRSTRRARGIRNRSRHRNGRFRFAPETPTANVVRRGSASGRIEVKSPMPGKVVEVLVSPGASVTAGQPVLLFEAMKMQNELRSPEDGVVAEVRSSAGQAIEARERLYVLVPLSKLGIFAMSRLVPPSRSSAGGVGDWNLRVVSRRPSPSVAGYLLFWTTRKNFDRPWRRS